MSRVAELAPASRALVLPHEQLGSDQGAVWFAVEDAELLAMRALDASLRLLYFERAEYDAATAALTPAEIAAAIVRRRAGFAPLGQALAFALGRRRAALAPAAQAGRRELFARALALLARWFGRRRFERAKPAFLLTRLVEREAHLAAELAAAGHTDEADERRAEARELADALTRHGSPEYARALPYVGLERGVRIAPGADLAPQLAAHHEPHLVVDGALIAPWADDELASLRDGGRAVLVMYAARGALLAALDGTEPQVRRDLAARAAFAERGPAPVLDEHLTALRLEQALFKRWTARAVATADAPLAERLGAQSAADEPHLFAALAAAPALADLPAELRRLDTALRADLKLFSALARAEQQAQIAADFDELAAEVAAEEAP